MRSVTPMHDNQEIGQESESRTDEAGLYTRLATPFDVTFKDLRGGVELEALQSKGERLPTG